MKKLFKWLGARSRRIARFKDNIAAGMALEEGEKKSKRYVHNGKTYQILFVPRPLAKVAGYPYQDGDAWYWLSVGPDGSFDNMQGPFQTEEDAQRDIEAQKAPDPIMQEAIKLINKVMEEKARER